MLYFWKKLPIFVLAGFLSSAFFISAGSVFSQEPDSHKPSEATPISLYEKPSVYITDLKINSQTKEKIEGVFVVRNNQPYEVYNLNYRVQLLKGNDPNNQELIDIQYEDASQIFYVLRQADSSRSFSYKIPRNIKPGAYKLRVQVGPSNPRNDPDLISMQEYGKRDINVRLEGENRFLEIDSASFKFLNAKNEFNSFPPNQEIKIGFDVFNPTNNVIVAFPRMFIDRYVAKKFRISKVLAESLIFEPQKKKYVELTLPKIDQPQMYQLFLQFVSDQSDKGEIYSSIVKKDFNISGPFAEILFIYHDKESYKKGDTATVKVTYLSSGVAQGQEQKKADLLVSVKNQETGRDCSSVVKSEIPFKGGLGKTVVQIPITSHCLKPVISQDLLIEGKSVDSHIFYTPSMTGLATILADEINQRIKKNLQIIVAVLAALGIIIFANFYLKRKKLKVPENV